MTASDDSGVSKEKSADMMNELPTMKAENVQNNAKVIYYSRTFMSIIGGVIAGILGLTGLMGFIFYFLIMAITSAGLAAKAGFSVHLYFDNWNRLLLDGFFGGLMWLTKLSIRLLYVRILEILLSVHAKCGPPNSPPCSTGYSQVICAVLDIRLRHCPHILRNLAWNEDWFL